MREIKFRGWHSKMNKMFSAETMAEDQLTLLTTGAFINVHGKDTALSTIYPHDKFIPLQFTGLKDKNGKEIYDGDIIRFSICYGANPRCVDIVSWCDRRLCWEVKNRGHLLTSEYNIEVIGNIYENPKLLS